MIEENLECFNHIIGEREKLIYSLALNYNCQFYPTFNIWIKNKHVWGNRAAQPSCFGRISPKHKGEEKKQKKNVWKCTSWHFNFVLMDSSRCFFGRMLSHLACFTMSVELSCTCQLLEMRFYKSNKTSESRSGEALEPMENSGFSHSLRAHVYCFWLFCLWTWVLWLLSLGDKQSTCWTIDQWSSRVHGEGALGVTKAGLSTKGTKASFTCSCLSHWWDTKLGSMKPPTKHWSSGHQSHSCKSTLFQTSGVLIQTLPGGELLVRNQYSSWGWGGVGGTLTHHLQRPVKSVKNFCVDGLKSLPTPSSTDQPGEALMQLSQVQHGFIVLKICWKTQPNRAAFTLDESVRYLKVTHCFQ